jgi:hypothetical protein
MVRLEAKYEIDLGDGTFHINRPKAEDLGFQIRIDGFDVTLCIDPDEFHGWAVVAGEEYWPTSKIRIIVARDEDTAPPIPKLVNGHLNDEEYRPYYQERESYFRKVALEVINRAILFFKYKLHNPNLFKLSGPDMDHPVWKVDGGIEFISPPLIVRLNSPLYNPHKGVGVRHLSREIDVDLEKALQCPIQPKLSEELLSDAQSAMIHDNFRHAVLEMAIACEIAVKQAFFAKTTPAGAAYEYLEEKQKVEASVMDLMHVVAKRAFGRSFKDEQASHYRNIDSLFRCRNKVAHRGELIYRDDSGVHTVDKDIMAVWWESVLKLLEWLKENAPA